MSAVSRGDIVAGLRDLGLAAGAGVVVHSSLKSFGRVAGGAQTGVEAQRARMQQMQKSIGELHLCAL